MTTSVGIAKPIPAELPDLETIAELTPITRPALSSSGPPELPGLMAASVWMTPLISRPEAAGRRRPSALMMPEVIERPRPNGLPIAKTVCPTCRSLDEPIGSGATPCSDSVGRMTARS